MTSFVSLTSRLTKHGQPSRLTLSKFTQTVAMSSMKLAVEWKRPKNKGYSSHQRAVFYEDKDVLWWIEELKKQGIEDYDIRPVLN